MSKPEFYPDWREKIVFSDEGPRPQILHLSDKLKVVVAGLEPGQKIPSHPEALAVFHFLEGKGSMIIEGQRLAVTSGTTIVAPQGTIRGIEAETRLAFLAVRVA